MLKEASVDLHEDARRLGFAMRCTGDLLKIFPIDAPTKVMLVLDKGEALNWPPSLRIWRHRTDSLTNQYKGRAVTKDWILGFMAAHSKTAIALTKEIRRTNRELAASKELQEQERAKQERQRAARPKERRIPGSARLCPECQGNYSFVTGNEDEDKNIVHCRNCEGGYLFDYRIMTDEEYYDLASQFLDQDSRKEN